MHARRVLPTAAVLSRGVAAGTMESRSGRLSAAPKPRSTVRREICFLVMYCTLSPPSVLVLDSGRYTALRICILSPPHLERRALHDPQYERREMIIALGRFMLDSPYHRH